MEKSAQDQIGSVAPERVAYDPAPAEPPSRPQLNESMVAWTVLRDLRDANQKIATEADYLMRAIEADNTLDKAMVVTMGIRPKLPSTMGVGQSMSSIK